MENFKIEASGGFTKTVQAIDVEHAAELGAELDDADSAEMGYLDEPGVITVTDDNGKAYRVEVQAEPEVTYIATIIDGEVEA